MLRRSSESPCWSRRRCSGPTGGPAGGEGAGSAHPRYAETARRRRATSKPPANRPLRLCGRPQSNDQEVRARAAARAKRSKRHPPQHARLAPPAGPQVRQYPARPGGHRVRQQDAGPVRAGQDQDQQSGPDGHPRHRRSAVLGGGPRLLPGRRTDRRRQRPFTVGRTESRGQYSIMIRRPVTVARHGRP